MASVFPVNRTPVTTTYNSRSGGTHLTRAMSRHAAAAVMVFALLQIALVLAARDMGFPLEDVAILLVVSVHREPMGVRISVNARAPVLMQVSRRTAAQYVFANTKYLIRQPLSI